MYASSFDAYSKVEAVGVRRHIGATDAVCAVHQQSSDAAAAAAAAVVASGSVVPVYIGSLHLLRQASFKGERLVPPIGSDGVAIALPWGCRLENDASHNGSLPSSSSFVNALSPRDLVEQTIAELLTPFDLYLRETWLRRGGGGSSGVVADPHPSEKDAAEDSDPIIDSSSPFSLWCSSYAFLVDAPLGGIAYLHLRVVNSEVTRWLRLFTATVQFSDLSSSDGCCSQTALAASRSHRRKFVVFPLFYPDPLITIHFEEENVQDANSAMDLPQEEEGDLQLTQATATSPTHSSPLSHHNNTMNTNNQNKMRSLRLVDRFLSSPSLASPPPAPSQAILSNGFYELPTCTVCLDRLDQTVSGLLPFLYNNTESIICASRKVDFQASEMLPSLTSSSSSTSTAANLSSAASLCTCFTTSVCVICRTLLHFMRMDLFDLPKRGGGGGGGLPPSAAAKLVCDDCGVDDDLYQCLLCGHVGCSRYRNQHARKHYHHSNTDITASRCRNQCNSADAIRGKQSQTTASSRCSLSSLPTSSAHHSLSNAVELLEDGERVEGSRPHCEHHCQQYPHTLSMCIASQEIWDYSGDAFSHRLVMRIPTTATGHSNNNNAEARKAASSTSAAVVNASTAAATMPAGAVAVIGAVKQEVFTLGGGSYASNPHHQRRGHTDNRLMNGGLAFADLSKAGVRVHQGREEGKRLQHHQDGFADVNKESQIESSTDMMRESQQLSVLDEFFDYVLSNDKLPSMAATANTAGGGRGDVAKQEGAAKRGGMQYDPHQRLASQSSSQNTRPPLDEETAMLMVVSKLTDSQHQGTHSRGFDGNDNDNDHVVGEKDFDDGVDHQQNCSKNVGLATRSPHTMAPPFEDGITALKYDAKLEHLCTQYTALLSQQTTEHRRLFEERMARAVQRARQFDALAEGDDDEEEEQRQDVDGDVHVGAEHQYRGSKARGEEAEGGEGGGTPLVDVDAILQQHHEVSAAFQGSTIGLSTLRTENTLTQQEEAAILSQIAEEKKAIQQIISERMHTLREKSNEIESLKEQIEEMQMNLGTRNAIAKRGGGSGASVVVLGGANNNGGRGRGGKR